MLVMTANRAPNGERNSLYPDGPAIIKGNSSFGAFFWDAEEGSPFGVYTNGAEDFGAGQVANQTFAVFNGTNGTPIPVTATVGNNFSGVSPDDPPLYFTGESHSGAASAEVCIDTTGNKYFYSNLGGSTKMLVSWVAKVPVGKYFPSGATQVEDFGSNPAHVKPIWVCNVAFNGPGFAGRHDGTHADFDMFIVNSGNFTVSSNDGMPTYNMMSDDAWSWTAWVRFLALVEAAADPAVDPGYVYTQAIPENVSAMYEYEGTPIVYQNGTPPLIMGGVQFPGLTDSPATGSQYLYDRIYVNYGDNVAARVEIGDNAVYSSCTNLQIMPLTYWDTENINAKYYAGTLGTLTGKYLHVTLSDNTQLSSIAL